MSSTSGSDAPRTSTSSARHRADHAVQLLLVEDSPVIRERLSELVAQIPGVRIVGEADTLAAAKARIADSEFNVVILDISLPDGNGLDALPDITDRTPRPLVFVLTNHAGDGYRRRALAAGATFFFDKSVELDRLVETLSGLTAGEETFEAARAESEADSPT